ncbi:MAG: hypothetical protein ACOX4K_11245 [Bacillota bacterium]|jgi:predicted HAD superfamily hydrolase
MAQRIQSEKEYIIDAYQRHFKAMRQSKIAIYGVGKNTRIILESFDSDNIVGLMDEVRKGDIIYGKRVITVEEAAALGVDAIIIVARASNVKIIYRRIKDACIKHSIKVYDINGNILRQVITEEKSFEKYMNISSLVLKAKIADADVVSFDVFDTLIMRKVLYPRDIYLLAEKELGANFAERRIHAEMALYREGRHPNINDIYTRLDGLTPDVELRLESGYLIRREKMCEMLQYALNSGKTVYLVSDMYLPGDILKGLLDGLGIGIDRENVLVSCDHGVSKTSGLFKVLRQKAGKKKILHIGDNIEADIAAAVQYGIDDTFHVESALGMLEDSYAAEILQYDQKLPNRLQIGEFISRQLHDPFLFSRTNGKFSIDDTYEMAYAFVAPLIYCFFAWLVKKAWELRLDCIFLAARDGFILKKIYDHMRAEGTELPAMWYFYTSRAASVLAGIIDDEDILHAARLAYSGKPEDMLKDRFRLTNSEIIPCNVSNDENYVLLHRVAIMHHAAIARESYMRYVATFKVPKGVEVGFFDFVSSGTCQKALDNIVDFKLIGLYFAAINNETEYKNDVPIHAMFGVLNVFQESYHLLEDYFFLENIMTSLEATVVGFDESGNPAFMEETRTEQQMQELNVIHNAILDYVKNTKITLQDAQLIDPNVPDLLVHFLQSRYSNMELGRFLGGELVDEFCNRTFKIW